MKLPTIPHDKANHAIYGIVIFMISNIFLNEYYSFGIVCLFAIGKEIYDQYDYGGFDYKDVLATIILPLLLTLKQLL